jgi:FtsH-binding integral membrane protein
MNSRRCSKPLVSLPQTRAWRRSALALTSAATLAACSASPSRNILGSYFPTWMICALLGLLGVVVLRAVIGKIGINATLPIPVVVYLCTWVAVTLAIWLLWLG